MLQAWEPVIPSKEILILGMCEFSVGMGQNLVPLVNPKIAGKWMFIPLNLVCIGIDPYPYLCISVDSVKVHVSNRQN